MSTFLVGGGGHALSIASVLQLNSVDIKGYFANEMSDDLEAINIPYFGTDTDLHSMDLESIRLVMGVGFKTNSSLRSSLIINLEKSNFLIEGFIARSSSISAHSKISSSAQVMCQAYVGPNCEIGNHSLINTGAVVEHHVFVGSETHIGPNATLCGSVRIGINSQIGANATVLPGISIGDNCTIGAGSVILRNVPSNTSYAGVPAREIYPSP